jgi:hypothetical protein
MLDSNGTCAAFLDLASVSAGFAKSVYLPSFLMPWQILSSCKEIWQRPDLFLAAILDVRTIWFPSKAPYPATDWETNRMNFASGFPLLADVAFAVTDLHAAD